MANKLIKRLGLLIVLCLVLLFTQTVKAHLDGGEDKVIGNYLIDFGFSSEQPRIGENIIFTFNLLDNETKEIIDFTSVWVRISSSDGIIFAGTLHQEAKNVTFSNTFSSANLYEITARFKQGNEVLIETSFPLKVLGEKESSISPLLGYRITLLFGIINVITLLLIFFSCRCLIGAKFVKRMWEHKWYQKYYRIHCYYWWVFFIAVIMHIVFAVIAFGNPF